MAYFELDHQSVFNEEYTTMEMFSFAIAAYDWYADSTHPLTPDSQLATDEYISRQDPQMRKFLVSRYSNSSSGLMATISSKFQRILDLASMASEVRKQKKSLITEYQVHQDDDPEVTLRDPLILPGGIITFREERKEKFLSKESITDIVTELDLPPEVKRKIVSQLR
jgi:hypothetical protein